MSIEVTTNKNDFKRSLKPKILWLSYHKPLKCQLQELENIFGNFVFLQIKKRFNNAKEVVALLNELIPDYVIPVLPTSFLVFLIEELKKLHLNTVILWVEMKYISTTKELPYYNKDCEVIMPRNNLTFDKYRFDRFQILESIEFKKKELI